jgi:DNA polymerase-3 subunit delta'
MNFRFFLGNEKIKEQLSFLLSSSHFPHAIILEGEEGIGKRTLARELAAYLVCRSEGEKPCYECAQCIKAQKGVHPDIFEHSATGGARSFHVEVIRDVINDVYMSPNEADYKIYILGNAHCMSESAQNALLKVLEEPPAYAVFILTAASKSMLLETVLSRAVTVSLSGVDPKLGAELITERNPEIDYDSAFEAVTAFGGNIGKAAESLDGGKMERITQLVNSIAGALFADNEYQMLKAVSELGTQRSEISVVLNLLKTVFRDALMKTDLLSGQADIVEKLSLGFTKAQLMALCDAVQSLIEMADKNANSALLATRISYELMRAAGR